MQKKERELWADYAKGLGILLVYVGHIGTLPQLIRIFIYLFHMPMFFFCMGYYIDTSLDFKTYLKKKAFHLLVPYYVYSISYMLYRSIKQLLFSHHMNGAEIAKAILGMLLNYRNTDFASDNWFIIASFVVCIYYYLLRHYLNKTKLELLFVVIISIIFTYLSYFCKFALPWYLDVAFPCLLFVYLGAAVKKRGTVLNHKKKLMMGFIGIFSAVSIYIILARDEVQFLIDYHLLRLFPYSLVTIGGVSLCLLIYAVFKKIDKKSILTYIGENSLIYYLFNWIPISLSDKVLRHLHVTNVYARACANLLSIIVITPLIVMFIKYFFWFLFGKKKEAWSFDYSRFTQKNKGNL